MTHLVAIQVWNWTDPRPNEFYANEGNAKGRITISIGFGWCFHPRDFFPNRLDVFRAWKYIFQRTFAFPFRDDVEKFSSEETTISTLVVPSSPVSCWPRRWPLYQPRNIIGRHFLSRHNGSSCVTDSAVEKMARPSALLAVQGVSTAEVP